MANLEFGRRRFVHIGHMQLFDSGESRTAARPVQQRAHLIGLSVREKFDAAIWQVPHPTGQTQRFGLLRQGCAIRDALHASGNPTTHGSVHNLDAIVAAFDRIIGSDAVAPARP